MHRLRIPAVLLAVGLIGLVVLVDVGVPRILDTAIVVQGNIRFADERDCEVFTKALPLRERMDGLRYLDFKVLDAGPQPVGTLSFLAPHDYQWPVEAGQDLLMIRRFRLVGAFSLIGLYVFLGIIFPAMWLLDRMEEFQ